MTAASQFSRRARRTVSDIMLSGKTTLRLSAVTVALLLIGGCSGGGGTAPAVVAPNNGPPTIGGSPTTTVMQGQAYAFTPTANDPDGDSLTFSISNQPAWASFDANTGALTGTPGASDIGITSGVTISVSDGTASTSLAPFDLEVLAPPPTNGPPTIGGTPPGSVTEGQVYSFTPTASDPNGDPLTFSISSAPTWATFDPANGTLSGTPQLQHVGITMGVTISVSDGMVSTALPSFDVEVLAFQSGSATVSWDAPTTNEDASPLLDLAGFRVHYGMTSQNYSAVLEVNDALATDATINGLTSGTWYFAVTAVDHVGNESAFSTPEVSKVVSP